MARNSWSETEMLTRFLLSGPHRTSWAKGFSKRFAKSDPMDDSRLQKLTSWTISKKYSWWGVKEVRKIENEAEECWLWCRQQKLFQHSVTQHSKKSESLAMFAYLSFAFDLTDVPLWPKSFKMVHINPCLNSSLSCMFLYMVTFSNWTALISKPHRHYSWRELYWHYKLCSDSGLTMPLSRRSVETLSGNEFTRNSSGNTQAQSSQLAEPLWTEPGLKSGICVRKLIST